MSAVVTRERPPARRRSLTDKFYWYPKGTAPDAPEFGFHVSVGFYADMRPCEVFAKPCRSSGQGGSQLYARCDAACMDLSWVLQDGVSLYTILTQLTSEIVIEPRIARDAELKAFLVRSAIDLVADRPSFRRGGVA